MTTLPFAAQALNRTCGAEHDRADPAAHLAAHRASRHRLTLLAATEAAAPFAGRAAQSREPADEGGPVRAWEKLCAAAASLSTCASAAEAVGWGEPGSQLCVAASRAKPQLEAALRYVQRVLAQAPQHS